MGEGFRVKTRKAYIHFVQAQLPRLQAGPLFEQIEETLTKFPCHLLDDPPTVVAGDRVAIVLRSAQATVSLIKGTRVVGRFEGEAGEFLRERFIENNIWPGVLDVTVDRMYAEGKMCDVIVPSRRPN